MSTKVSIVTISFNQQQFLEECIQSVLAQTHDNVEYIVVDPGSTDGSRDIIEKYRDRITKIIYDKDNGPADGLNNGFKMATGVILGYINADDRIKSHALETVVNYFETHPKTDVVSGAIEIIDEHGCVSRRKRTSDKFDLAKYVAGVCTVAQQASFFRQSAFRMTGGFNVDNRIAWDGELWVDMALSGCVFETINIVLANFRVYDGSITGSGDNRHKQLNDLVRLGDKISKAGEPVYSDLETRIRRYAYKINLSRHIAYLTVR